MRNALRITRLALADFVADQAVTHAAAVAFFTILSLAPLLIVLLSLVGMVQPQAQRDIVARVQGLAGPEAGAVIETILQNTRTDRDLSSLPSVLSLVVLFFAATGVFVHVQAALNKMWGVQPRPRLSLWSRVRQRATTFLMVLIIGLLFLASVILGWVLRVFLPDDLRWLTVADGLVSLISVILMFALLYRFLPDTKIRWHDVWFGAVITGVLFTIGRYLIGLYLQHSNVDSAYGTAGSLVLLLLLIFYSSLILFFGAELTQVYARSHGHRIQPADYAQYAGTQPRQPRGNLSPLPEHS